MDEDDAEMYRLIFGDEPPLLGAPVTREEWAELWPTREEQQELTESLFPRPKDAEIIQFPGRKDTEGTQ